MFASNFRFCNVNYSLYIVKVKETINLLRTQITDTVIVGRDLTEAANFRGYFILTALEPSKVF